MEECHTSLTRVTALNNFCNIEKLVFCSRTPHHHNVIIQVSSDNLKNRVLRFSVYDVDKRRVRHSLGHILVPLQDLDLTKGDVMYRDLEPNSQVFTRFRRLMER